MTEASESFSQDSDDYGWWARRIGNRRLARGYCPICNSSPPDPTCAVCHGSHDYGPNQSHDQHEHWWVEWHRIIGFPEPLTKGLVAGRGVAPKNPPPPAAQPSHNQQETT